MSEIRGISPTKTSAEHDLSCGRSYWRVEAQSMSPSTRQESEYLNSPTFFEVSMGKQPGF